MNLRYTIIDRINTSYIIEEPAQWDSNAAEIKRHPDWHGIFITTQSDALEFDGIARDLLKSEYDLYGAEGEMTFLLEEDCGQGFFEFSRGRFDFNNYQHYCESGNCYVKVPVINITAVSELTARISQKVDLQSLLAFDETTALPAYSKLPFEMLLPSKGVFLKDKAINEAAITQPFEGLTNNPFSVIQPTPSGEYAQITIPFAKTIAGEIGAFDPAEVMQYIHVANAYGSSNTTSTVADRLKVQGLLGYTWEWPLNGNPIINYHSSSPNYGTVDNPLLLKARVKFKIKVIQARVAIIRQFCLRLPEDKSGELWTDYEILDVQTLYSAGNYFNGPVMGGIQPGAEQTFDTSILKSFNLLKGDRIYLYPTVYHYRSRPQYQSGQPSFEITFDPVTDFELSALSHTPATPAKVFAVHEAFSRIAESITNDKLRVKSDYFGRTDSQPYTSVTDGCGSMEVITDGIRIRRQEAKTPGKTSVFALSITDMLDGISPIHNIGMGIEPDTARPGFNRLRIEEWDYFYQPNIILSCTDIAKITRKVNDKDIYSTFQFGYAKWEAEEYNGIDEFLGKRTYRTTLSQSKNDLIKLSKFLASGYALEVTRRKGNDTKDWRYDKDTFIICVKRGGYSFLVSFTAPNNLFIAPANPQEYTAAQQFFVVGLVFTLTGSGPNNGSYTVTSVTANQGGFMLTVAQTVTIYIGQKTFTTSGYVVEQGGIINPANIIDPPTIYNFRISPVRNALRWMNRVFASYRQFGPSTKILFTDGDGNYFAEGELSGLMCKLEAGLLKENQTIDVATFDNPVNAEPILLPERVTFDYPMSTADYQLLQANPYGLIHFDGECDSGDGWIDTINFKQDEGMATFTLIPKAP